MNIEWLSKVVFDTKSAPLKTEELSTVKSYLGSPLTENEISALDDLCSATSDVKYLDWKLPSYILPDELVELLQYSNGGNFYNGDREIGLFGLEDIRDYYLRYLFPEYQPGAVPFGFNGGGTFYAYDLRKTSKYPPIIATSSGCLDWDESVVIGHSLGDVFSKTIDIDDEFTDS